MKLLHVGLGPLGRMITADAHRRGIATVVEAVDIDPALVGKPLKEIVPETASSRPVLGSIRTAGSRDKFDAAVLTTSSDLRRCEPALRELIALDLPIVSTCEELLYPWLRHQQLAEELHAACLKTGARLLGTGVNPGFLMDTLPVAATAVCRSVRRVRVWRVQDATPRRVPFQKKIGAALTPEQFKARIADGSLRHVGLGESLHFLSRYLGLPIDRWEESIEPVNAERDLDCAVGHIAKGLPSGVRQVAKGWAKGDNEPLVELVFQAAIAQANPHDRIRIEGEPTLDMTIDAGVHGDVATTAITLNAIPSLIAAPAGLHTMATIPVVHFVAAKT